MVVANQKINHAKVITYVEMVLLIYILAPIKWQAITWTDQDLEADSI